MDLVHQEDPHTGQDHHHAGEHDPEDVEDHEGREGGEADGPDGVEAKEADADKHEAAVDLLTLENKNISVYILNIVLNLLTS